MQVGVGRQAAVRSNVSTVPNDGVVNSAANAAAESSFNFMKIPHPSWGPHTSHSSGVNRAVPICYGALFTRIGPKCGWRTGPP